MELLIVDDEKSEIEAVQQGICWDNLEFIRINTALDIIEAKKILESRQIDVLLCDIEMPMGSGLELLEWVNANTQNVCSILMTCHAEFSYAQQAVHLGSFEYILKPLDFGKLEKVLKDAIDRVKRGRQIAALSTELEESKVSVKKQFWRSLIVGDIGTSDSSIKGYITGNHLDIPIDGYFLCILVCSEKFSSNVQKEDRKLYSFVLRNMTGELFRIEETEQIVEVLAEEQVLIILSSRVRMEQETVFNLLRKRCVELINAVEQYLHIHVKCFAGEFVSIDKIYEQIENLNIMNYYNAPDSIQFLRGQNIPELSEKIENKQETQGDIVEKVKEYIRNHLSEEIIVEEVAAQVYFSADYLNRIFKKRTELTLLQYIVQQKMERAKFLLRNTDLQIGDIAAAVGYYNYSSFYRIFLKTVGQSPQEWKTNSRT